MEKNRGIVYITVSLLALSLGGDAFFYASKQNMSHQKERLENRETMHIEYGKKLLSVNKRLAGEKNGLRTELARGKNEMTAITLELSREIENRNKAASYIADRDMTIARLNEEAVLMQAQNNDLETRIGSLTEAYKELLKRFNDLYAGKKKSDRQLKWIIKNKSDEEAVTSLGTVVISK